MYNFGLSMFSSSSPSISLNDLEQWFSNFLCLAPPETVKQMCGLKRRENLENAQLKMLFQYCNITDERWNSGMSRGGPGIG
jgi:hypothetical protein